MRRTGISSSPPVLSSPLMAPSAPSPTLSPSRMASATRSDPTEPARFAASTRIARVSAVTTSTASGSPPAMDRASNSSSVRRSGSSPYRLAGVTIVTLLVSSGHTWPSPYQGTITGWVRSAARSAATMSPTAGARAHTTIASSSPSGGKAAPKFATTSAGASTSSTKVVSAVIVVAPDSASGSLVSGSTSS